MVLTLERTRSFPDILPLSSPPLSPREGGLRQSLPWPPMKAALWLGLPPLWGRRSLCLSLFRQAHSAG